MNSGGASGYHQHGVSDRPTSSGRVNEQLWAPRCRPPPPPPPASPPRPHRGTTPTPVNAPPARRRRPKRGRRTRSGTAALTPPASCASSVTRHRGSRTCAPPTCRRRARLTDAGPVFSRSDAKVHTEERRPAPRRTPPAALCCPPRQRRRTARPVVTMYARPVSQQAPARPDIAFSHSS